MAESHPVRDRRRPTEPARVRVALLLALAAGAVGGCADRGPGTDLVRPMEDLVRRGDLYLDPETLEPFTGTTFATFAHQPRVIAERATLRQGTFDGPYETYFADRTLSTKEVYRSGRREGPYEWYFASGRLFERGTFSDGVRHGPYEAYWEDTELHERGTYRDGVIDGVREWYLGSSLVVRVTYRRGVVEGLYERYEANGLLRSRGILAAGRPCGHWFESSTTISYPPCGAATE
jgi:hypothetical protein